MTLLDVRRMLVEMPESQKDEILGDLIITAFGDVDEDEETYIDPDRVPDKAECRDLARYLRRAFWPKPELPMRP